MGLDKALLVKVCGIKCERNPAQETIHKLACTLPPMHSVSSVRSFPESVSKGNLKRLNLVSVYSSHSEEGETVFDGDTSTGFGQKEGCYVGIKTG